MTEPNGFEPRAAYSMLTRHLQRLFPLRSSDRHAEPWRRLLAAAVDTSLFVALVTVVVAVMYARNLSIDSVSAVLAWAAPIVCWMYVLICWSIGRSVGMWITDIRIVTLAGKRPGPWTALKRIAGYLIAVFPVKAGLVPILYHPRRQGWHDRIAGTVVVKGDGAPETDTPPADESGPAKNPDAMPVPDFGVAAKAWPAPLAVFVLIACGLTYPVCMHLGSRMAGVDGDNWQYVWSNWFIQQALRNHTSQIATNTIFYPLRVSLLFHTMALMDCYIAQPLLPILGSIRTYNVILIGSLALNAMSCYVAACSLTRDRLASFTVAGVFGFSPFFITHALGHAHVYSAEFFPIAVLMIYAALVTLKKRYALLAGILVAVQTLDSWEFLVYSIVAASCLAVAVWMVSGRTETVKRIALTAGAFAVAGVLLSPLLVPALTEQSHEKYMNRGGESAMFRADLSDYVAWPVLSPWVTPVVDGRRDFDGLNVETQMTPGLVMVVLVGLGLLYYRRLYVWQLTLLVALVMTFGPVFSCGALPTPAWLEYVVLGFPGNGFDAPWDMSAIVLWVQRFSGDATTLWSSQFAPTMPFAFLQRVVPFLKPMRDPARFDMLVLLCAAIVSASVMREALDRLRRRFGPPAAAAFSALVLGLLLLEYDPLPYPTCSAAAPAPIRLLGSMPDTRAVIDVPLTADPRYMYDQTIHHRPILIGYISRAPSTAFAYVDNNAFLSTISGSEHSGFAGPDAPPDLDASIRALKRDGVGYVVIHKDRCDAATVAGMKTLFSRCRFTKLSEDRDAVLYRM